MQVPEGHNELDGERKERTPRPNSHISPEPAHRFYKPPQGPDEATTLRLKENRHQFEHFVMAAWWKPGRQTSIDEPPPRP
jgi:hypothetical protein